MFISKFQEYKRNLDQFKKDHLGMQGYISITRDRGSSVFRLADSRVGERQSGLPTLRQPNLAEDGFSLDLFTKALQAMLPQILQKAEQIGQARLAELATQATDDAIEVLKVADSAARPEVTAKLVAAIQESDNDVLKGVGNAK